MFHDANLLPDTFTPLTHPDHHLISDKELANILEHKYKATKSRGLSKLPLQLLKFLGPKGIHSLASFLNDSAIR
jgi:hypothetical protein